MTCSASPDQTLLTVRYLPEQSFFYIHHIDLDGMSTNADCSSGAIMKYCIFYIYIGWI